MSDSDEEEFINAYSSTNTKALFKKQVDILKKTAVVDCEADQVIEPLYNEKQTVAVVKENTPPPKRSFDDEEDTNNTTDQVIEPLYNEKQTVAVVKENTPSPKRSFDDEEDTNNTTSVDVVSIPEESSVPEVEQVRMPKSPVPAVSAAKYYDEVIISSSSDESINEMENSEPVTGLRRSARLRKSLVGTPKPKAKKKKKVVKPLEEITIMEPEQKNVQSEDIINYQCNVKINWKSAEVVRIPMRRFQKLQIVFDHFMEKEKVPFDQIMLRLNGKVVKPTDTPETLNLTVIDFIDGGIVSSGMTYKTTETDASKLSLNFQNNFNKTTITLPVSWESQMKAVMLAYAEQIDRPLDSLTFTFDGIQVNDNDTPDSLELENGYVIDVSSKI